MFSPCFNVFCAINGFAHQKKRKKKFPLTCTNPIVHLFYPPPPPKKKRLHIYNHCLQFSCDMKVSWRNLKQCPCVNFWGLKEVFGICTSRVSALKRDSYPYWYSRYWSGTVACSEGSCREVTLKRD